MMAVCTYSPPEWPNALVPPTGKRSFRPASRLERLVKVPEVELLAVVGQEPEALPVAVVVRADLVVAASHLAVVVAEDEAAVEGSTLTIHRQFWGDGKIYYVTRGGDIHVIKAGDTFEKLATNRLTSESEEFSATPAISDGQIFFRSSKHLYCVSAQ